MTENHCFHSLKQRAVHLEIVFQEPFRTVIRQIRKIYRLFTKKFFYYIICNTARNIFTKIFLFKP